MHRSIAMNGQDELARLEGALNTDPFTRKERKLSERAHRDVILIGASEGGFHAVAELLAGLPKPFDAAIAITLHRSPTVTSDLAPLLRHRTGMDVIEPRGGELFQPRRVYLAPADHHLELRHGALWLSSGPKENYSRPAIDVMFRSGARAYGPRVIGVILTGNLSDGIAGLIDIEAHGGLSLAQEPADAAAPELPQRAIQCDDVDLVFALAAGPSILAQLVHGGGLDDAAKVEGTRRVQRDRRGNKV